LNRGPRLDLPGQKINQPADDIRKLFFGHIVQVTKLFSLDPSKKYSSTSNP
jgi:hypothetical protein